MSYTLSQSLVAQHHATLQAEARDTRRASRASDGRSFVDRLTGRLRGMRRIPAPSRPVAAGC
jgi:hypothetical protein